MSRAPAIKLKRGNPGRKCTVDEGNRRTEHCILLLGQERKTFQIKEIFSATYGLGYRQTESYISRARKIITGLTRRSRVEWTEDLTAGYLAEIADPRNKASDRNAARNALREMLGLDAPKRVEMSGPEGGPLQTESLKQIVITWPHERPDRIPSLIESPSNGGLLEDPTTPVTPGADRGPDQPGPV